MTRYLLDTNICIYIINKSPSKVFKKIEKLNVGDLSISSITLSELQFGISKSHQKESNQILLNQFLSPLEILDYPKDAAIIYGEIRAYLEKKGTTIGALDLLIASHCITLDYILVTNNKKEFSRVPKLKIENWT